MNPGKLAISCSCWFFIVPEALTAKRKSILPLHPTGGASPPSGTGMSSFGPPLPSLLAAPPDDEVVEVEPCSVPLEEELLLPELLEPAGTVVITGSVMSGNPLPGEFPHALSVSARVRANHWARGTN